MSRQFKSAHQRASREWPWSNTPSRLLVRRGIAFAAAAFLLVYVALDGGGYDIVVRQTVSVVIWGLVAVGFALGVLPRSVPIRVLLVPAVAVVALALWMLLSFGWTASDERTTAELARLLGYAGLGVLALMSLNRDTFRAAGAGLSVAALGIAAIAVASRLVPGAFEGATDVASQFRTDRLDFPLDYWNAVGAWGAMSCAIGLAWSAHARLAITRAVSLAAVPVAGLAVYLSYSRGGVVGAAAALAAVLVLSRNRWTAFVHALAAAAGTAAAILAVRSNPEMAEATGDAGAAEVALALVVAAGLCAGAVVMTSVMNADRARLPRDQARWVVPAFVGLLLVVAVIGGRGPISEGWDEFRSEDAPAAGASDPAQRLTAGGGNRNDIWSSAIDAFEAEPARGVGAGTFEFFWLQEADDPEYVRDAHSVYLEHAAELGFPGALLLVIALLGLLASALVARQRLERSGDIAASVALTSAFVVFCVNAGVDWMWEETAVAVLGIGGVAVAAAGGSSRRSGRRRRGVLARPGGRAAIVVGAVFAALVQIPGIVSTQRVRASEEALAAGDVSAARAGAEQAIDAQPWAAGPHAQLAVVEREAGDLETAQDEIEEAIEREPDNWEWPLVLAPIQADLGDRPAAIETFTEGRKLAPHLQFYSPFLLYGQQVYSAEQLRRKDFRNDRRAAQTAQ